VDPLSFLLYDPSVPREFLPGPEETEMAKKITKAPKAPAKAPAADPVSTAWNEGKTMTLHSCMVSGKSYKSVWAAFKALGMGEKSGVSRGQHIRFRKALKAKGIGGKLGYKNPVTGKVFEFTLTKPATPV
jgi:hypothetical protein